jgi:hypothetical protein
MLRSKQAIMAWIAGLALLTVLGLFVTVSSAHSANGLVSPMLQGEQALALAPQEKKDISSVAMGHSFVSTETESYIYIPLTTYSEKPATTLPFQDDFMQLSPDWTVFLNYPGLTADDWYWTQGIYYYDPESWEGYALSMYLGPGSDEWTDYQVIATVRNRREKVGGIWIRGTYEDLQDMDGGRVGGYYVMIKPQNDYVYLLRIRPETRQYFDAWEVASAIPDGGIGNRKWYHLKVAVEGNNIKVWLKEKGEPESAYEQLINYTDGSEAYMQGTVGFVGFRTNMVYDDITVTELP